VNVEDDFDIAKLGAGVPCYVRKVNKPSVCGDLKKNSVAERAALIRESVLSEDGGVSSFLYVETTQDVIRTVMAINWARRGVDGVEDLSLLAFAVDELEGTKKKQTPDRFICHWAKRHHWDITLSGHEDRIANQIASRNRLPKKYSRKKMEDALARMVSEGCRSVECPQPDCICQTTTPAPGQTT
jgi:hypothetical protein